MTHIVVRRCTLEIVRRSGVAGVCTDAAEKRVFARRILPKVLRLLEDVLSRAVGDMEDRHIRAPLRLTLALRINAAGSMRWGGWDNAAGDEAKLAGELHEAHASGSSPDRVAAESDGKIGRSGNSDDAGNEAAAMLLRLLVGWLRQSMLVVGLRLLSEATLERWHDAICRAGINAIMAPGLGLDDDDGSGHRTDVSVILEQAAIDAGAVSRTGITRPLLLRWRLAAFARLAERFPAATFFVLSRAIDARLPLPAARAGAPDLAGPSRIEPAVRGSSDWMAEKRDAAAAALPHHGDVGDVHDVAFLPAKSRGSIQSLIGTVEVDCCLPFLLLRPLYRTGVLQSLAAVFGEPFLRGYLPHAACALAYKVMDPPERGWRRSPNARNAAAVFAGMSAPPPENEIVDLARCCEGRLSALSAAVAAALLSGKDHRTPFLLVRAGGRLTLFDADGLFPVLVGDSWADIARAFDQPASFVFVSSEIASSDLLVEIDATSIAFLITGRPVRGERWTQSADAGWCTNRPSLVRCRLPSASDLEALAAQAVAVAEALLATPTSVPLAKGGELEQTAGLAAALALGHIAWLLAGKDPEAWRSPDPLLARERFETLSARVCFSPERVEVVLPLGRRHRDLRDIGLLDSIPGVPWLGDRPVEFRGG
ncbi:MAG: hypothetical protein U1E38_06140 [Rhodospirillales bacterium]